MIVSHKYKFVFIKTTKTAGTSIEIELAKLVGDGDIVTPIKPPVEGHCARNYRMRDRLLFTKEFYNHMPARLVRDYLGARRFDDYFKFCVEREPVEKCVSHFSMLKNSPDHGQGMKRLTWDQYVSNGEFPVDIDKYTDAGGSLIVDRIIRYENLDREMAGIAENSIRYKAAAQIIGKKFKALRTAMSGDR